ncbi:hypothetical protein [Paraburkholderia oxyphila]|uniref:hypothetical protein n=1 Tax=Paraburkholderia oxyphila TaxID=614212 RepID=UPI000A8D5E8C|nr:hypothetical protein [Paraburkholderia oxyphila]
MTSKTRRFTLLSVASIVAFDLGGSSFLGISYAIGLAAHGVCPGLARAFGFFRDA